VRTTRRIGDVSGRSRPRHRRRHGSGLCRLLRRWGSKRGWTVSRRDKGHAGRDRSGLAGSAKDNHTRDRALAAKGEHEIGIARHVPYYVCDRALETSSCWFFLERRVPPLDVGVGAVQQPAQDFTEWHVAHFDFDAEPIIAKYELIVRRNRESANGTDQSTDTSDSDGAAKAALPTFPL